MKETLYLKKYLIAFYDAKYDDELIAVLTLDEFARVTKTSVSDARIKIRHYISGRTKHITLFGRYCIPHLIKAEEVNN